MISLIVRCQNRLQYTIKCIEALAHQKDAPPFEIVLVDDWSDDGTAEWVRWIQRDEGTRTYFPAIRYFRPTSKLGDWGGMIYGAQHVSPNAGIVGQLDNDIELHPTALAMCAGVLANKMAGVVMLRRYGVRQEITMKGQTVRKVIAEKPLGLQRVDFCVAFWLTAAAHFSRAKNHTNCRRFTAAIGNCQKIMSLRAVHMEGWEVDGPRSYIQKRKYNLAKWQLARKKGIL